VRNYRSAGIIYRPAALISAIAAGLVILSACGGAASSSANGTTPTGAGTSSAAVGSAAAATTAASSPLKIIPGRVNFTFTKYCGTKPAVVGILDSFGGNAWAVGKRAMLTKFAESCPNVKKVLYADANGDLQNYISDVNSLSAQGANIIETFDLFGAAALPAFEQAQRAGVLVGEANAVVGNATVPQDLTSYVLPNFNTSAKQWVQFLTKATNNKGLIIYVGGPAGNEFDAPTLAAIQNQIKAQGSGIKLVTKQPLVGAWDPATTQQVVAGFLQKDPNVTGVITTYNATIPSILRAFKAANVKYPALTGQSNSMQLVCMIHQDPKLQVQSLDGSTNLDAIALAKLLSVWSGNPAPELGPNNGITQVTYADYIDTVKGIVPPCNPSLPPGADLSTPLDEKDLAAALKGH
jgi:ribose transport system substrate-binding protein